MATEYRGKTSETPPRMGYSPAEVYTTRFYQAYGPKKEHESGIVGTAFSEAETHQTTYLPGSYTLDDINEEREDEGKHPVLFHQTPAMIDSLYSDPSMRHTVPTLLGLIYNDTQGDVTHSANLSLYSSRIVKKAIDRGLVIPNKQNPTGKQTNWTDMEDHVTFRSPEYWGKPIPDAQVRAARDTVRSLLRGNRTEPAPEPAPVSKPAHLSPQFHPQLPGLESM